MLKTSLFLTVSLFGISCATLVNGTKQSVSFYSEPPGADITIYQKGKSTNIGKTPLTASIPRKTKTATFNIPGYYEEKIDLRVNADIHWLYFLDCFALVVPAIIDLSTGGHIIHEPSIKTELKKK
jgi:hypothetical protein